MRLLTLSIFRFHRFFELGNLLRLRGRFFLGLGFGLVDPGVLGRDVALRGQHGSGKGNSREDGHRPDMGGVLVPHLAPTTQVETQHRVGDDQDKEHGVQNEGKQQGAAQLSRRSSIKAMSACP